MKKILFLICLGIFVANTGFSQMSFTGNALKKSSFDLTEKKAIILNNNFSDSKILIATEENDLTAKRRRSSRGKGRGRDGSSEGGVYVSFGLGYGLGLGSQNVTNFTDETNTFVDTSTVFLPPTSNSTEDQINVSLGKGLCINAALGYMINGSFGFEVGMSYLMGAKNTATKTTSQINNSTIIKNENTYTYQANMFRLNPSVVIASGMEGVNPYAKFGMTIGFGSFTADQTTNNTTKSLISDPKL